MRFFGKFFYKKNDKLTLTLEGRNARAGYLFILPFLIGFVFFMFAPLFDVLIIANKLKINLFWQIYYVFITGISLFIGCVVFKNAVAALYCLAIGRSTAYLLGILLSYHYAKCENPK